MRKVLIIEDEETLARNIQEYLEVDGFEAQVCGDGEAGLAAFEAFRPEVVLLDLRLPGLDGLAVLERLRGRDPGAKVIMMSAHCGAQVAAEARRAGACTFLAKPLALSELRRAIDQLVAPSTCTCEAASNARQEPSPTSKPIASTEAPSKEPLL